MSRMAESVGAMMRELADSMKAERAGEPRVLLPRDGYAAPDLADGYAAPDWEARLAAKYRNSPVKLSAEVLAKLKGRG